MADVGLVADVLPSIESVECRQADGEKAKRQEITTHNRVNAKVPAAGVPQQHNPIAVFEQQRRPTNNRCFKFMGWYKIARLEFLAPHSDGPVRMMARKWETVNKFVRVNQKKRDTAAWENSMKSWWAVVKMEVVDEETAKEMGDLKIERAENDDGDWNPMSESNRKNVNELLAELRMTDSK
ncbi:hypothetical protein K505DRAFT_401348 [Melanomma pulvis-pyrius CBS 109.77]|uniref:Uncharacterized protein n=1 Tax=Melanomma pulvis-pyrius CBS 109.77 TaxID=1314802 RepID=A0A6A6XJV2_9PLEO|nr:hypothetical protein K505DRAFT_401348 [Melanomma pulvis-pyrius CBS 109.77]